MSESRNLPKPAGAEVFSAADINRQMAEREAAEAADDLRHAKEQQDKQKALAEELPKPFDRSPDQLTQMVKQLVTHAAEHGQSEGQVYGFPSAMCSDRGRRIDDFRFSVRRLAPEDLTGNLY